MEYLLGMRLIDVRDTAALVRADRDQPFGREQYRGAGMTPLAPGNSLVMYDQLGAGVGHVVGFTEGAEATAPFPEPTPVDAYCAAIIDQIFYQPPA